MLQRPQSHLDTLSAKFKWESTRRHPLYQWLWDTYCLIRQSHSDDADQKYRLDIGCIWATGMLGVNGIPADPATDFNDLVEPETNLLWLKRAANPITFRFAALLLASGLSPKGLKLVSSLLWKAARGEIDSEARDVSRRTVSLVECPELDGLIDLPIFHLNPSAPSKEFVSDLTNLRDEWRERQGVPNSRTSEEKLRKYLRAWDLREGWHDGSYHRELPMTLEQVAKQLDNSRENVKYGYQQGFKLISGHEFSFDAWAQVMGPIQFAREYEDAVGSVMLRRLWQGRSMGTVDDTTLSKANNDERQSVVATVSAARSEINVPNMIAQIQQMISEGRTNEEIRDELGLGEQIDIAIQQIRDSIEMDGA